MQVLQNKFQSLIKMPPEAPILQVCASYIALEKYSFSKSLIDNILTAVPYLILFANGPFSHCNDDVLFQNVSNLCLLEDLTL